MSYRFFENKDCEYYPCHNTGELNCLFCFCPLYPDMECGGSYVLTNGVKDCSSCNLPHTESGYDYIISKLGKKDD